MKSCSLAWKVLRENCGLDRLWEANSNIAFEQTLLEHSTFWSSAGWWRLQCVFHSLSINFKPWYPEGLTVILLFWAQRMRYSSFTIHKKKLWAIFKDFITHKDINTYLLKCCENALIINVNVSKYILMYICFWHSLVL